MFLLAPRATYGLVADVRCFFSSCISYLQDAVERVEGDGCPGRQRIRGVVLVVERVHVFVQELVRVQGPVHPVDLENGRNVEV